MTFEGGAQPVSLISGSGICPSGADDGEVRVEGLTTSAVSHGLEEQAHTQGPAVSLRPGVLLVAAPELNEPAFMRSVIYLLEHHEGGSMGVILNRPLAMKLDAVWESCPSFLHGAEHCASGGPVELHKGILLHGCPAVPEAFEVSPGVFIGGEPDVLEKRLLAAEPQATVALRLFLGHAGWSPGQLAAEMNQGTWLLCDGNPALVFDNEPDFKPASAAPAPTKTSLN